MKGLDFRLVKSMLQSDFPNPLPGGGAHKLLAPVPRPNWVPGVVPADGKPAAVLILLFPMRITKSATPPDDSRQGDVTSQTVPPPTEVIYETGLLYTERTDVVRSHQRQICFPGGSVESGETAEETALRETEEEIGIPREMPQLLGRLSPLWISATGFTVTPVVAMLESLPELRLNPHEVKRVIEYPLCELMQGGAVKTDTMLTDGIWVKVPHFTFPDGKLWGATAMMTSELLTLLGWPGAV